MKDNSLINEILIKAITGVELSSADQATFNEWLLDEDHRADYEQLKNNPEHLLGQLRVMHVINSYKETDWSILEQKLALGKRKNITRTRQWKLFRDVATSAAAVLILAAAIFFWYNNRKQANDPVVKEKVAPATNDVAPGQTKAQLILADGSKFLLDSTVKGKLAEEGETVIENANGTLTYKGRNEPPNELQFFNTLITAKGETYAMELADGSKVWLNAGASIRYPAAFTGSERRVEITGEVYFEVNKMAGKPFVVHVAGKQSPGMDVQVLGTHFNINAYNDDATIKTTLLEGAVKIIHGSTETLLKPHNQAQLSDDGNTKVIDSVDTSAITAWKNGMFDFNSGDITSVMNMLAKWYNIEVEYEGVMTKQLFKGGTGRDLMLSKVLKMLEQYQYRFRIEGRKVVVIAPVK